MDGPFQLEVATDARPPLLDSFRVGSEQTGSEVHCFHEGRALRIAVVPLIQFLLKPENQRSLNPGVGTLRLVI